MKRVAILGATGSIGRSALSVIDANADRLEVVGLAAGENASLLAEQITRYRPKIAAVGSAVALDELLTRLGPGGMPPTVDCGADALIAVATHPDVDIVMCASAGTAGLEATLAAIDAGKTIALANKEVLVMAGSLMMEAAHRKGVAILPVDSEHNAIHQCLHGRRRNEIRRLVLTASGGPFRNLPAADLARVTPEEALKHPTWQMGRKITVDSATLMNKGLEVIEARWLFGMTAREIDVVIHPQSVVHSMVELRDGSVIAQLSVTDMRLPIQYAFAYPDRWEGALPSLDISRLGTLEFLPPDLDRFPCLRLAYDALKQGGAWPIALNAANEVAVEQFLAGRLTFSGIPRVIEAALDATDRGGLALSTLADVRAIDAWARDFSLETIRTLPSS
ncbi:MAG TPA: 1-deoxy-D-xylulose-5-phosphate reductoisomerase [Vicinamibacterales bacterium]|nr:1-deoxy-D-xylulose-5-phosphate reductoisomerase [Vicinamibacterales bacterium]